MREHGLDPESEKDVMKDFILPTGKLYYTLYTR